MSKKMHKASENINVVLSWIFLWLTVVLGVALHLWTVIRLAIHATIWKALLALITPVASELVVALDDVEKANGVLQGAYPTAVAVFFIIFAIALITRILKPETASTTKKTTKQATKKVAKKVAKKEPKKEIEK